MNFIIRISSLIVFLLVISMFVAAQENERRTSHRPSPKTIITTDTTNPAKNDAPQSFPSSIGPGQKEIDTISHVYTDSTVIDTARVRFIPGMGQVTEDVDTTSVLHQSQFLWSDAKNVEDLLWKVPGMFYRDLGEAGKWGQLSAFGIDGRGIGILLDGRPMNDPVTGTYNLSDMPLEFIDHIEILSGSSSMLTSGDDGTALNFASRSYNSLHPMTKLRFVQDPKGTILTDGIFAQNVARGLNLMIGFERATTLGRYPNAYLDAWNVRIRLRYNVSERLNIALTDFYTKAGNGLNGGLDPYQSASLFDETSAIVYHNNAHDDRSRRDVTLSAIARIFPDSASTTHANFYYSTLEREYWNPPDFLNGQYHSIDDSTIASFWGIRIQQQLLFGPAHLSVGGNFERRQTDSTRTLPSHIESEKSLFAQAELRLTNFFVPSVSLRSSSLDGESSISTGIGAKSILTDWLTLFVDAFSYDRFPTIQERYWRDSIMSRPQGIKKEQHSLLQAGFQLHAGPNVQLNMTWFQQIIKNAIVFRPSTTNYGSTAISISNIDEVKSSGINGSVAIRWHQFEIFGTMSLMRCIQSDTVKTFIPDVILAGEASYREKFFKEKLDAKFGVRSRFYNRQHEGMQFDPQTLSYSQYTTDLLGRSTTFDLFMVLKIGDAHISLSWNNILGAGYMLAPIYPMPGRNIRLGVNWVFFD